MVKKHSFYRRHFVATTAGLGITSLAGCNIPTRGDKQEETTETVILHDPEDNPNADPDYVTEDPEINKRDSIDTFLENVDNYGGTIVDATNNNTTDIIVGGERDSVDRLVFDPPAVEVSFGTEVRWEWTSSNKEHQVKHAGYRFESESTDQKHTYAATFEREGLHLYHCAHHEDDGMRGALIVNDNK